MTQKWWMIVAGLGMFMITIFGFLFASSDRQPDSFDASLDELPWEEESVEATQEDEIELTTVVVDVKGEVERPGVYEFDQGYRVDDAFEWQEEYPNQGMKHT
ncbi:SLBB domain-containing protein [Geomicrobium sp. JCM 19039]|uniref:SLBB domain-containing protein n=1 Tax=Geomicrobium sp. JCM 19039 TaxID=1460636 RepID=UPI00045F4CDC|nr:SLBB domain-containing protein [Geomicrobium sp. JCM 19039]GAK11438.1 hypothetical protein JCM19039_1133 [Geomicrobium sp. JCM 19039]